VKRFSDKRRGENKGLEQERDSKIAHFALMQFPAIETRTGAVIFMTAPVFILGLALARVL